MPVCLIGLGSNLGDRARLLQEAVALLVGGGDVRLLRQSAFYETLPIGGPVGQPQYLNAAVLAETHLALERLLERIKQIELWLGRRPGVRWGPRPVDLDLLLYDEQHIDRPGLQVPHPRMAWRRFVLEPAAEVAPQMRHPLIGWTIAQLLEHLNCAVPYVAMCGLPGSGKTELLTGLAARLEQSRRVVPLRQAEVDRALSERGFAARAQRRAPMAVPYSSSGQRLQYELQLLLERSGLLAADHPQWQQGGTLWVSDFWIGQSLAYAQAQLAPGQRELFRRDYAAVEGRVIQPRLLVFLGKAGLECGEHHDPSEAQAGEVRPGVRACDHLAANGSRVSVAAELYRIVCQPGLGPVLHLEPGRPNENLEELLAAVLASD